jgi:hypothetical protein
LTSIGKSVKLLIFSNVELLEEEREREKELNLSVDADGS